MTLITSLFLWMFIGCQPTPEYGICEDICKEVYSTCQFAAYPSFDSCLEGCFYNEEVSDLLINIKERPKDGLHIESSQMFGQFVCGLLYQPCKSFE